MELIKDHQPGIAKLRIVLQHPDQNTFGHHLDSGGPAYLAVKTDPVADGAADPVTHQFTHPGGSGPGGQTPRLKDNDLAAAQPGLIQQDKGGYGGFPGTRFRCQNSGRAFGQSRQQLRQNIMYWQFG